MSEQLRFNIPNYVTVVKLQETTDGDYCYVAFHPELPSVISQGNTAEEAKENLVEATELTITHLVSNGLPIPEPKPLKSAFSNLPVAELASIDFASITSSVVHNQSSHESSSEEQITAPSGQMVTL